MKDGDIALARMRIDERPHVALKFVVNRQRVEI